MPVHRRLSLIVLFSSAVSTTACTTAFESDRADDGLDDGVQPGPLAPGCESIALTPAVDPLVDDYNTLLEAATTLDWPFAVVTAWSVSGCEDLGAPEVAAKLPAALIGAIFADHELGLIQALPLVEGGASWLGFLGMTREVIVERTEDGNWDPTSHPDGPLYGQLDALFDGLSAPVESDPSSYAELPLHLELEECSAEAAGLIDVAGSRILAIRILSRC